MRKVILKSILTAVFLSGAALAQTQTPAEAPAVEPAPQTAPAEGGESETPVDWALSAREAFAANFQTACSPPPGEPPLSERAPEVFEHKYKGAIRRAGRP